MTSIQTINPFVVGYVPSRVIRHVARQDMTEESIRRYLDAAVSVTSEFVARGGRYHLLADAREKTYASLGGVEILSKGLRTILAPEEIHRSALVSEEWFGSGDADGLPSFLTLPDGWFHLTEQPYSIPMVSLVVGSTGAGKTTIARFLAADFGAVRFSIDEWMNQLFMDERPEDAGFDWYWPRIQRCEAMMRRVIEPLVNVGTPVVLDLGLSTRDHREAWTQWARQQDADPWIYYVDVPAEERWRRVQDRNRSVVDDSMQVSREMFDFVEERLEAPTAEEGNLALVRW